MAGADGILNYDDNDDEVDDDYDDARDAAYGGSDYNGSKCFDNAASEDVSPLAIHDMISSQRSDGVDYTFRGEPAHCYAVPTSSSRRDDGQFSETAILW